MCSMACVNVSSYNAFIFHSHMLVQCAHKPSFLYFIFMGFFFFLQVFTLTQNAVLNWYTRKNLSTVHT